MDMGELTSVAVASADTVARHVAEVNTIVFFAHVHGLFLGHFLRYLANSLKRSKLAIGMAHAGISNNQCMRVPKLHHDRCTRPSWSMKAFLSSQFHGHDFQFISCCCAVV